MNQRLKAQQLLIVSLLAGMLLIYSVLSIANVPRRVGDIPALYAYVFGVWVVLIGLTAWLVERYYRNNTAHPATNNQVTTL